MDPRVQPHLALVLSTVLALGLACGVGYKPAVTVDQVAASIEPGRDLVAYLEQTAADPAVCDVSRRDGASIQLATPKLVSAIGKAFAKGTIPPERWAACTLLLWSGGGAFLHEDLQSELISQIGAQALDPDLGLDPQVRGRATAVLDVLEHRRSSTPLPARDAERLLKKASKRVAALHGAAAVTLQDLVAILELEGGLHQGEPVDAALIAVTTDEALLSRWSHRHPDAQRRRTAGAQLLEHRLVRLPETHRAAAREAVLAEGFFALPADAVVRSARWEPGPDDTVMLRLLQNPKMGWVRLLPAGRDESRAPDPSVDLRGALQVSVQGWEEPITLCPGADAWDPRPCYPPDLLEMSHAIAVLAPTGRVLFPEQLALDDVLRLGSDGDRLATQIVVGGAVAELDLPIFFDSVPGFEYGVGKYGSKTLKIQVWELSHERLLIEFNPGFGQRRQLVPLSDASFRIHARLDPGGHYGTGGDILVRMRCTHCKKVRAELERMVTSEPGTVTIRRIDD